MGPTYNELIERIGQLKTVARQCQRVAPGAHPAAILNDVDIPLEIIANLAFLLEQENLSETAQSYVHLLAEQLLIITSAYIRSLEA